MSSEPRSTQTGSGSGRTRQRSSQINRNASGSKRPRLSSKTITAVAGVIVVVVLLVMGLIKLGSSTPEASSDLVPPTVLGAVTGVSTDVLNQVGAGTIQSQPTKIPGTPLLGSTGKPVILYIGSEFCPYCAAQRWPMAVALSRFGTFTGLRSSHSASDDVFPNTPTFTFVGATYQSDYIEFQSVELQSNVKVGGTYQALQTPTAQQNQIISQFNQPPYVPSGSAGSIPFLDIGNQYMISGASFSPGLLAGKSIPDIAGQLNNASSDSAKAIVGAANILTAAICSTTRNSPAAVCEQPAVRQLQAKLQ